MSSTPRPGSLLVGAGVAAALARPLLVRAQIVPCSGIDCKLEDLFTLLVNIFNFALGFAGVVAMLFIILGGAKMFYWMYMENADQELAGAKYTVTRAIWGLIIVLAAYLIVNTLISLLGGGGIDDILP